MRRRRRQSVKCAVGGCGDGLRGTEKGGGWQFPVPLPSDSPNNLCRRPYSHKRWGKAPYFSSDHAVLWSPLFLPVRRPRKINQKGRPAQNEAQHGLARYGESRESLSWVYFLRVSTSMERIEGINQVEVYTHYLIEVQVPLQ
jgi:hypothetical protein